MEGKEKKKKKIRKSTRNYCAEGYERVCRGPWPTFRADNCESAWRVMARKRVPTAFLIESLSLPARVLDSGHVLRLLHQCVYLSQNLHRHDACILALIDIRRRNHYLYLLRNVLFLIILFSYEKMNFEKLNSPFWCKTIFSCETDQIFDREQFSNYNAAEKFLRSAFTTVSSTISSGNGQ